MAEKRTKSYKIKKSLKTFWNFLWNSDSLLSYILNFFLAFLLIKFIFFPTLGFVLKNNYPVVAIVSGSMEHKITPYGSSMLEICDKYVADYNLEGSINFDDWWHYCGDYYETKFNLTKTDFKNYPYNDGLNIGDIMILYGTQSKDIKVGDIIVFIPNNKEFFKMKGPVIHRVVRKWKDSSGHYHFQTKGDHNAESFPYFERDIPGKNVIGTPIFRIPYLGYAKILLNKVITKVIS